MSELADLCTEMGITCKAKHVRLVTRKPDGSPEEWQCDEWQVTIAYQGKSLTTTYRTGLGHRKMFRHVERSGSRYWDRQRQCYYRDAVDAAESGASKPGDPPTVADVLYCLMSEANAVHMTFEEWCSDFGYDSDSRKAERVFHESVRLGREVYRVFRDTDIRKLTEAEH